MSANASTQPTSRISSLRRFVASYSRLLNCFASPLHYHGLTLAVSLAILSAVVLPVNLLSTQRFHHDEALYATWALHITSGVDPWLAHTPIDKPPLFLYLLAGAMRWLGVTEAAARLPSLLATALTVGLTFGLGRKLYGNGVGIIAAWLVSLSPFTILFAPTVFTDPLLVALILVSCLAAAYGRAGWAGVALGLAMATKQQGVFFVPLTMGLLTICHLRRNLERGRFARFELNRTVTAPHLLAFLPAQPEPAKQPAANDRRQGKASPPRRLPPAVERSLPLARFLLAATLTMLPVLIWNFNRRHAPDFLSHSLVNYGGLVSDTASFNERWWGFMELLHYGTASPLLNGIFLAGVPLLLIYGLARCRATAYRRADSYSYPSPSAPLYLCLKTYTDWLLSLFTLLFLLGHAFFSFQIWDRYLLGLIPFLALLLARILMLPWSILKDHWLGTRPKWLPLAGLINSLALTLWLIITLAGPVQNAANGRYPLGSHSQALSGIEQIVAYLQGHAGANHTLYHRWLGTHWRFYLWGYPYDLQYWASPTELAAKARPGHLIAFPSWQSDTEARLALAGGGLTLQELTRAYHPAGYPSVILYQIVPSRLHRQAAP